MDRLTKRINVTNDIIDEVIVYTKGKYTDTTVGEMTRKDIKTVLKKLADYEDAEEKRLLFKLPCKVGDTVWIIDKDTNDYDGYLFMANCGEYVIVATEYVHCAGNFQIQLMEMVDESYDNFGVDVEIFHKDNVFLTKEEAEKALDGLNE